MDLMDAVRNAVLNGTRAQSEGFQGVWKAPSIKPGSDLPDQAIPLVPKSPELDRNNHVESVW